MTLAAGPELAQPNLGAHQATSSIEGIDPTLQMLFQTDSQDRVFAKLRKEQPVHYLKNSQYGPLWNILKFKDIVDVEMDYKTFSSDILHGGCLMRDVPQEFFRKSFIHSDPPYHGTHRNTVKPIVGQDNLARMEGIVRGIIKGVLDTLPVGEVFDWVERVSVEITGRVLCQVMGAPEADRKLLTYWSDVANVDLQVGGEISSEQKRTEALGACGAYFAKLLNARKQEQPLPDLISMMAHSSATANLPMQELLGTVVLLLVGANDTTRNSMSGGLLALNQFGHQYRKLLDHPQLVDNMIPEIIRWVTPVPHMRRTVTQDVEFRGQHMKKGDKVVVWYISGNRDEEAISDPYEFIIDRANPRNHLSFGMGVHRCLGNRIAELQLKTLWEEILSRRWAIDVVGQVVRQYSNWVRGIERMPVRIRIDGPMARLQ